MIRCRCIPFGGIVVALGEVLPGAAFTNITGKAPQCPAACRFPENTFSGQLSITFSLDELQGIVLQEPACGKNTNRVNRYRGEPKRNLRDGR
jgi:hypothetical protein